MNVKFKWERDVSKLLCLHKDAGAYPIVSGQRQGNTLSGWPVHHRVTVIHTAYKSNAQKVLRQTLENVCVSAVDMLSQRLLFSAVINDPHRSHISSALFNAWSSCTCSENSTFMKHVVLSLILIEMQWHLVAIWGEGHAIQYIQPCLIYDIHSKVMGPVCGSSINKEFGNVKRCLSQKLDTVSMLPVKHTFFIVYVHFYCFF